MTVNDYLVNGCQLMKKGDLQQAAQKFFNIINLDPNHDEAYFMMGVIAYELKKINEAIKLIEKAISINPIVENYYYHLGIILLEAGRIDEAIVAYQKATRLIRHYSKTLIAPNLLQYLTSAPTIKNDANNKQPFCCFSFPKCGTHLLSDIIQKITDIPSYWPETTGLSLDVLYSIPDKNFLIGHFGGNTEGFDFLKENGYKIIVNYRDPRDQLVSFYYYYTEIYKDGDNEWGDILRKFNKEQAINILTTTNLCGLAHPSRLALWLNSWLEFSMKGIPMLFVTYEDLIQNKLETILKISSFLGHKLPINRAKEILTETSFDKPSVTLRKKGKSDGNLKRKGIVGDWRNHFTQLNKDTFNSVAGQFLTQLGYDLC